MAEDGERGSYRHQDGEGDDRDHEERGQTGMAAQDAGELTLEGGEQEGQTPRHCEDEQEGAEDLEGQE